MPQAAGVAHADPLPEPPAPQGNPANDRAHTMIAAARRRPGLALGLIAAVLLTAFFGLRTLAALSDWHAQSARPVEGWMTPRYLVRVYDLPPDRLAEVLGLSPGAAPRDPLETIAKRRQMPLPDLIAAVEALMAAP
jgi:hypothetical protein